MGPVFAIVLSLLAIFLILLVLVQRGRGGGLTGALGGMGGSSAFGAKAGDVFTRITIVTAGIWIAFCVAAGFWANPSPHPVTVPLRPRLVAQLLQPIPRPRPKSRQPKESSRPLVALRPVQPRVH